MKIFRITQVKNCYLLRVRIVVQGQSHQIEKGQSHQIENLQIVIARPWFEIASPYLVIYWPTGTAFGVKCELQ